MSAAIFALTELSVTAQPNQTQVQNTKLREMAAALLAGTRLR